ncbi:MAG: DUF6702 family protein [Gemmatimonadales bacterium]
MTPVAAVVLVLGARAVHPLHTTLTTIAWRAETRTFHVAVRVFTQDLSDAVARVPRSATGRSSVASRDAAADSAACRYARAALTLRDATGRRLPLRSCTVERADDVTWIRLEAPADAPGGLRVLSAFLFELFGDQINIVQASLGGRAQTMLFTQGTGPKPLG